MTVADGIARTLVVLGARADVILERVDLHGAEPLVVEDWREGQAASLRAAVGALGPDCDAVVVALGDQPCISPRATARVAAAVMGPCDAARANYGGVPGHPIALKRALFGAVERLTGDQGARGLLRTAAVREVECDGEGSPIDVDTADALDALRRVKERERGPGRRRS